MQTGETTGDALLRQTERLQTLNEISRVVSATLDLRALYDTIYQQIGRVMDPSQFLIALHRPGSASIEVPYLQEEGNLLLDETFPYGDNTTSVIIDHGTSLLYHTTEEYQQFERDNGLTPVIVGEKDSQSGIFVPLNTGSRTIGALSVQSPRPNAYAEEDVQILSVIAAQAAVAIENARFYAASQKTVRQAEVLLDVAQTLTRSLDLESVLDAILTGMAEVVPYYFAAILLPDPSTDQLLLVGAAGCAAEERRRPIKVPVGHGVTGKAFQTGEPLLIPDVHQFSDSIGGRPEVHSEMAVPLKRGDSVVGVLDVERHEIDAFSAGDLNLLRLFASQAAIAIENARLFTQQRDRVSELQTIQSLVQKLTVLHDMSAIAAVIDQELRQLIDFHTCRLFLWDPPAQLLRPLLAEPELQNVWLQMGEGLTGWIALHGQSVIIPNTVEDSRASYLPGTPQRAESMIGAPLAYEGRVRGVIALTKLGTNQFDEHSLRLLEIIAAQSAMAFDRARLYDELRTQAITDELTKLYNRRYLLERFREEKSRAIRNQHTLAATMVDIDNFKRVNDTYGHDAGDVVLQDLATVIRAVVRAEDVVARYGGEEFCVLLSEIPLANALHVSERLRTVIERRRLPQAAGLAKLTASVGVALLCPDDEGTEIFTRADQAMYEVKRAGGNRVCVYDAETFQFYQ